MLRRSKKKLNLAADLWKKGLSRNFPEKHEWPGELQSNMIEHQNSKRTLNLWDSRIILYNVATLSKAETFNTQLLHCCCGGESRFAPVSVEMKPLKPIVSYMNDLYTPSQSRQTAVDSLHVVVFAPTTTPGVLACGQYSVMFPA